MRSARRNAAESFTQVEIFPFANESTETAAFAGLIAEVEALKSPLRDQMTNPNNVLRLRHGRSWSGPEIPHGDNEGKFVVHSSETLTHFDDVLAGDLGLMERQVSDVAK